MRINEVPVGQMVVISSDMTDASGEETRHAYYTILNPDLYPIPEYISRHGYKTEHLIPVILHGCRQSLGKGESSFRDRYYNLTQEGPVGYIDGRFGITRIKNSPKVPVRSSLSESLPL